MTPYRHDVLNATYARNMSHPTTQVPLAFPTLCHQSSPATQLALTRKAGDRPHSAPPLNSQASQGGGARARRQWRGSKGEALSHRVFKFIEPTEVVVSVCSKRGMHAMM
jgi:hypothetical protein